MYELILNYPVVGLLKVAKKAGGQLFPGRGHSIKAKDTGCIAAARAFASRGTLKIYL